MVQRIIFMIDEYFVNGLILYLRLYIDSCPLFVFQRGGNASSWQPNHKDKHGNGKSCFHKVKNKGKFIWTLRSKKLFVSSYPTLTSFYSEKPLP